jgi:hypothetical protein
MHAISRTVVVGNSEMWGMLGRVASFGQQEDSASDKIKLKTTANIF